MRERKKQSVDYLKTKEWGKHVLKLDGEARLKSRVQRRKKMMGRKPGWEFCGKICAEQMIYIIASAHGFKIGISNDPLARLRSLQTGSPIAMHLYRVWKPHHAASLEKKAHSAGRRWRMHGEWFRLAGLESLTNFIQNRVSSPPIFEYEPLDALDGGKAN